MAVPFLSDMQQKEGSPFGLPSFLLLFSDALVNVFPNKRIYRCAVFFGVFLERFYILVSQPASNGVCVLD